MNSISVGFSKVVTVGSEFQLAASDYLAWLATDEATDTVGIVAESIKDPEEFADAVERIHLAGKGLVVLKVGNSEHGSAATNAHTGALITSRDAYDHFFAECGVAVVRDYDELVASLECLDQAKTKRRQGVAIVGISGGQTALACDVAEDVGVKLARFEEATRAAVRSFLPGSSGENPIDIGATIPPEQRKVPEALRAVLADDSVGALAIIQDSQASLNPYGLESYSEVIGIYGDVGKQATKPVVVVSPTFEPLHERIVTTLSEAGIPLLRGLRPAWSRSGTSAPGRLARLGGGRGCTAAIALSTTPRRKICGGNFPASQGLYPRTCACASLKHTACLLCVRWW